jgi:hypothetical protein
MKVNKFEIETKLNSLLGTNIRWSKLPAEDLMQVYRLFTEEKQKLIQKLDERTPQQKIADGITGLVELIEKRPLISLIRDLKEKQ